VGAWFAQAANDATATSEAAASRFRIEIRVRAAP
jgi:hypothetical protein